MANFALNGFSTAPRTLASGESGFITQNGALVTLGTDAVNGSGFNTLTVLGTLAGQGNSSTTNAYVFSGTSTIVNVGASGDVYSPGDAINVFASSSIEVINAGTIMSAFDALDLRESDGGASIEVINSGLLEAGSIGIVLVSGTSTATVINTGQILAMDTGVFNFFNGTSSNFLMVNSGEIIGQNYGYIGSSNSDQTIYNTGLISGTINSVFFQGGSNLYDGTGGQVIGSILGGTGVDTIIGGDYSETVDGRAGNDFLRGMGGNDVLNGGADRDVVRGGEGADILDGGAGSQDWLDYRGSSEAVIVNLGTGQAQGGDASGDEFVNFERIIGTSQNDILTGDTGDNVLRGDNGNDFLRGGSGDDLIAGGRGSDNMLGSSGVDSLDYRTSSAGVTVNLVSQTASGGDAQGDTFSGFENVYGSAFDDVLTGSSAANLLSGGAGNDIFHFRSNLTNVDMITDFSPGNDTIELEDAIFTAIVQPSGTMLSGYFKANVLGIATDANDRIIYDTDDGLLYYDADGNGAGASIQFAQLNTAPALAFSDFDIV